jgi:hypothetical protein
VGAVPIKEVVARSEGTRARSRLKRPVPEPAPVEPALALSAPERFEPVDPLTTKQMELERDIPVGKVVHVILDNYATHQHQKVRAWLTRHPRWTFHSTPTSSSWLNAVGGFFAKLTRRRLKRGVFHSLVDLQAASTASSPSTIDSPNLSSGKPTPTRSTRRETEGSQRWNQSTSASSKVPRSSGGCNRTPASVINLSHFSF